MVIERRVSAQEISPAEERVFTSLRPSALEDYIGQRELVDKLRITLEAAGARGDSVGHILFHGPPGLGKTTLSHIIAKEMGSRLVRTSGPSLTRPFDLVGVLTDLQAGDVLFIDEIHRMPRPVEEYLYPAMEDYEVDFISQQGPMARSIKINLKRFSLIGATTRPGSLSAPLRDRFERVYHVDFYSEGELKVILERSAGHLGIPIEAEAAAELARRSRGTPRTANRLLLWVRDFSQARKDGAVSLATLREALAMEGVDEQGLDALDRSYLRTIIGQYGGGPVGVEAIAATMNEETDTLVDVVEPYLLRTNFVQRTRGGRRATPGAFRHLALKIPEGHQGDLWSAAGEPSAEEEPSAEREPSAGEPSAKR
ncbi:MAG: Holliday junction branch migration DNA helicase RuvB, partial [bacterium]